MTKLKAINVFLLQWFFIRLTKCTESVVDAFEAISYDMMPDGSISARGRGKTTIYEWYSIQLWIVPCTGWWSEFIYLSDGPKFSKLTKRKIAEGNFF